MKRSVECDLLLETFLSSATELNHTELARVKGECEGRLSQMLVERSIPLTEALFSDGGEIWFHNVLSPLSLTLSCVTLCEMRRVNKLWNRLLGQVRHLNLDVGTTYINSERWHRIWSSFPRCVSLHTDVMRLRSKTFQEKKVFGQLEELVMGNCHVNMHISLDCLPNLTFLSYPSRYTTLTGLDTLTNLTELNIDANAFYDPRNLTNLTKLKRLTIRGMPHYEKEGLQKQLPLLTYLNSDRFHHFEHFTGDGRYAMEGETRTVYTLESEALRTIQPDCSTRSTLEGIWLDGIFTGHAHLIYCTNGVAKYEGRLENGVRHGTGVETLTAEKEEYQGEWQRGKRHGRGRIYVWDYDGHQDPKLSYESVWREGIQDPEKTRFY